MTIKEARMKVGITQQGLSELLDIPKRTIQAWEAGKRIPPDYVERLVVEKLLSLSNLEDEMDTAKTTDEIHMI